MWKKCVFALSFWFLIVAPAVAQGTGVLRPRDQLTRLKGIAALPEADQLQGANQGFLQDWFLDNVEFFYRNFDDLAISRHPDFQLGTDGPFRRILMPPRGGVPPGNIGIYVRYADLNSQGKPLISPETFEPYISFPRTNVTKSGGIVNTCWHEMLHALLGRAALAGAQANCPRTWNGNSDQERREHMYIENVQNKLQWFRTLQQFESAVRKAAQETRFAVAAQASSPWAMTTNYSPAVPIIVFDRLNYDLERQIWSEAHMWWWFGTQRDAFHACCWLPDALEAEFEAATGIRLPEPDQVVAFYMQGGVQDEHGVPVRVPEWVFTEEADLLREIVQLEVGPLAKEEKGDEEIHRFRVKVSEFYRNPHAGAANSPEAYRRRRPVTRGVLSIQLQDSDAHTGLFVRMVDKDGRPLREIASAGGGPRGDYFEVDLFPDRNLWEQAAELEIAASIVRKSDIKQDKTYIIDLRFRDRDYAATPPGSAVYSSAARPVWLVVEKSTPGTPPPTPPAQPTPPAPPPPPGAAPTGPAWELQEITARKFDLSTPGANQHFQVDAYKVFYEPDGTSKVMIDRGTASTSFTGRHRHEKKHHGMDVELTWSDPGDRIPPGRYDYELIVKELGGAGANNLPTCVLVSCGFYLGTPPYLYGLVNSHVNPARAADSSGSCSKTLGQAPAIFKDDYHPEFPAGSPGEVLQFQVELVTEVSYAQHIMTYGWVPAPGGKKPGKVKIEVKVPPPPPPPPPPEKNDNVFQGETIVIEPPPPPPPPPLKKSPRIRWYYHAEKGYRLPLPETWAVHEIPEDELDLLVPPAEDLLLSCGRGHGEIEEGETLHDALHRLAAAMQADLPGATTSTLELVRGEAVRVDGYDDEEEQTFVHFYVGYEGWTFYLGLMSPPGAGRFTFPTEVWNLLGRLDFINEDERRKPPR